MKTLFKAESTKAFFQSFAKDNKVGVMYDHILEPIATDLGQLILPHPTFENEEIWHGQAHKELSYLTKDNKFLFNAQRAYKEGTTHHLAASVLADNIAEKRDYGKYRGRSKHLTSNRVRLSNNVLNGLKGISSDQLTPESELLRSLINYDIRERKGWMKHGTMNHVEEQSDCQYMGNMEAHFPNGIPLVDNTGDFQDLVQEVVKILEEPPEPEMQEGDGDDSGDSDEQQQEQQDQQQGDSSDESEGTSEDEAEGGSGEGEEGQSESEGSAQGSEEEGEAGDHGDGVEPAADSGDSKDANNNNNKDLTDFTQGSGANNIGSEGTGVESKTDGPLKEVVQDNYKNVLKDALVHIQEQKLERQREQRYTPVTKREIITGKQLDDGAGKYRDYYNLSNVQAIKNEASKYPISKKLRKYLQVLATTAYSYGHKKGRMNNSKLYRAAIGEREPRVYKQKLSARLKLDTAITVLTDCSGSMRGHKEYVANIVNTCVFDVLRTMQISYEALGFSDMGRLNHMLFKEFHERLTRDVFVGRLCSSYRQSGGNSDGDSLLWACERLMTRTEPNKVMIVLSDGQPAGSYKGNGGQYLKKLCRQIETQTPINLWGVGILTNAPEQFYKNHYICGQLHELEGIVLDILRKSIVK